MRKCTYGNIFIHLTFPNVTPAHPQSIKERYFVVHIVVMSSPKFISA